ncbi:ACT domain-containing protein [Dactylosporangium sp. CA-092794]|uniref:ACT domain-containing protein n=1 Tax=Dactylosporangium sp. CA-092794 TaxID=3239929 RepID=UPI003D8B7A08
MNIFTVDLKNQPGELAHVCEALGERGVNVEIGGVTAGDRGLVYFTAGDEDSARTALDTAGVAFTEHPAMLIKCADQPGEAGRFARKLTEANINIEGLLATSICGGEAVYAMCVDKPDDARRVLGDQVIR